MHIDAHQHFWKYDPLNHAWINNEMSAIQKDFFPEDLAPLLRQHDIEGCVTVQVEQTEEENHFLLSLASQNAFIKGVVGWIDLKAPNLEERLQYFKQFPKLKGFRHIVQGEPKGFLTNRKFIEGVKKLAHYDFTYDLLVYHYQLGEAIEFAEQLPDVKIVVDHIAKPPIKSGESAVWGSDIMELAAFENIVCKISGMVTEAAWKTWRHEDFNPYLDKVFENFGAERIMYGSDWPVCLVAATYQQQFTIVQQYISRLSFSEKQMVMGENAETFYNL
jgi:L-fuconolactonase